MRAFKPYVGELVIRDGFFYEILRPELRDSELRLVGYSDELRQEVELSVREVASSLIEEAAA